MSKKSIEDLFKESFENFEAEVSPSVWSNIKTALRGIGLGFIGKALLNKIGTNAVIAIVSSVATVIATVGVMHWSEKSLHKSTTSNASSEKPVTKEPTPVVKHKVIQKEKTTKVDNSKPQTSTPNVVSEKMQETKVVIEPFVKDRNKMKSIISQYSSEPIALVFPSPTGGTVPLIVSLSNTGKGVVNKWKYSDGKKDDNVANPVHVFENPGVYTVYLISTDQSGKTATDSAKITVTGNSSMAVVPRELSPNGDGKDDFFVFSGANMKTISGQIFDRKANILFECNKVGAKWDGKDRKGLEAQPGIYFYIVTGEGNDGKHYEQKGSISLIREENK